jgi:hypothetical protein
MIRTPADALVKADPVKLAAKYAIPVEWARFYISSWIRSGC